MKITNLFVLMALAFLLLSGTAGAEQEKNKPSHRIFTKEEVEKELKEKGLVTEVDDPQITAAMKMYDEKMAEIGKTCPPPNNASDFNAYMEATKKCVCDNKKSVVPVLQKKIDAFSELLKRRPELSNQSVKIKGQKGNIQLDPGMTSAEASLVRDYGCK